MKVEIFEDLFEAGDCEVEVFGRDLVTGESRWMSYSTIFTQDDADLAERLVLGRNGHKYRIRNRWGQGGVNKTSVKRLQHRHISIVCPPNCDIKIARKRHGIRHRYTLL